MLITDQLAIRREQSADAFVLALAGELDIASAPHLETALVEAEAAGASQIVIDLSGLHFMDSTGLHVLLSAQQRSVANGHRLLLRQGPRAVRRVFELTQTAAMFQFS